MHKPWRAITGSGLLAGALVLVPAGTAGADEIGQGRASAFGATVEVAGQAVVPPLPEAVVQAPPGADVTETVVDLPVSPVAVSGTITATAAVHGPSDLPSTLTVNTQSVEGGYNARATTLVEGLDVLLDVPSEDVSLVSADVVRSEAVAVCRGGAVTYGANSEIVDLRVGGTQLPLNAPVEQILDAVSDLLAQSGLNQVVDVQRNVITPTADGIAVDALVVTVLAAAGDPVAEVVIGHAEVSGVGCGQMPECSDGADNDGDGAIDHPADPQCLSPQDDSEAPECSNGRDDDGDGAIDHPADPQCLSPQDDSEAPECSNGRDDDGDGAIDHPADPGCTDPNDDSEIDEGAQAVPDQQVGDTTGTRAVTPSLARTGGTGSAVLAAGLGLLGLAGLALRRRLV